MPASTKIIIIGAGIVGNSIAYHLTQLGVTDLMLIEKGPIANPGGSTSHASNFIFPVDHSKELTALITESVRQYEALGVFHLSGGIEMARTPQRLQELQRRITSAGAWGIAAAQMITAEEIREHVPYVDVSQILGGYYSPGAGVVESVRAAEIMRERAIEAGLEVIAETEVLGIRVDGGRTSTRSSIRWRSAPTGTARSRSPLMRSRRSRSRTGSRPSCRSPKLTSRPRWGSPAA
jgi:glycine/D-amino acid oxidase-like deaminating enzyme